MMIIDAVDSVHQVGFALFFTLIFFCALSRIELLIDVLPDLEKNRDAFMMHKIVWAAIAVNEIFHSIIACTALYLNSNLTPDNANDVNPYVVKLSQIAYMVFEFVEFYTYWYQLTILYKFSRSKLSKVVVEDVIMKEEVNLIVFLQTRRLFRCQLHDDQLRKNEND